MPFQKGHPRYGGRKKGSAGLAKLAKMTPMQRALEENRRLLAEARETIKIDPLMPLDALLMAVQVAAKTGNINLLVQAAGVLAPYMAPRLVRAEVTTRRDDTQATEADLLEEMKTLRARIERAQRQQKVIKAPVIETEIEVGP